MRRTGLQDGMYCGVRGAVPCLETAGFGMECGPLCNRLSARLLTGANLAARLGMKMTASAGGFWGGNKNGRPARAAIQT